MKNQGSIFTAVVEVVESLNKSQKRASWLVADLVVFSLSSVASYLMFYDVIISGSRMYLIYTLLAYIMYLILSHTLRLDTRINRYSGITDLIALFGVVIISSFLSEFLTLVIFTDFSFRFTVLAALLSAVFVIALRTLWQNIYLNRIRPAVDNTRRRRVVLIGAGDGGFIFMNSYRRYPYDVEVIGILDSDPFKIGTSIGGVPVMGDESYLEEMVHQHNVEEAIIAIPSLNSEDYERILRRANELGISVYKMPKVEAVLQGKYRTRDRKKIEISDLLNRQEIELDETSLRTELEGKTILITGAGGSIGSEIVRQISKFNPKRVLLLGHGENSIYNIYNEMLLQQNNTVQYSPIIADVQDYDRLVEIFEAERPSIVYHAAAHKHVPLMESNPQEALKNNIIGSYSVARAVDITGVPKMVMISTDKAVNPPNVMGASKRIAELLVTGMNSHSESIFCAVRFGNVLGSRGSVVPVFERQIAEGGPVTVTDFRMTRYFMTIPEASRLVIYAGAHSQGGEVFILDMGEPVHIVDLAKKMILLCGHTENEIEIIESGIRPGEKLYEELLTSSELVENRLNDRIFIGKVTDIPLDEIESFVSSLKEKSQEEMKQMIIEFANMSTKEKVEL